MNEQHKRIRFRSLQCSICSSDERAQQQIDLIPWEETFSTFHKQMHFVRRFPRPIEQCSVGNNRGYASGSVNRTIAALNTNRPEKSVGLIKM